MKLKLAAACVLATIAFQAKAHPSCGAGGRNAFREYRDKLQPMISARVRSVRSDASIERINIVSLSIKKDGVVMSSEIAKSSDHPSLTRSYSACSRPACSFRRCRPVTGPILSP
ncbi:hypothetical protein [Methylorubrum extorquens]